MRNGSHDDRHSAGGSGQHAAVAEGNESEDGPASSCNTPRWEEADEFHKVYGDDQGDTKNPIYDNGTEQECLNDDDKESCRLPLGSTVEVYSDTDKCWKAGSMAGTRCGRLTVNFMLDDGRLARKHCRQDSRALFLPAFPGELEELDPGAPCGVRGGAMERIEQELAEKEWRTLPDVNAHPDKGDLFRWIGFMVGPKGTPYDGGAYFFSLAFPEDYPSRPPAVMFTTKIYHCNVDAEGLVSSELLGRGWDPSLGVKHVLFSLPSILAEPSVDHASVQSIARQYRHDRQQHDKTAAEWRARFAC